MAPLASGRAAARFLIVAVTAIALLAPSPARAACDTTPFNPKTFNWSAAYSAYPVNTFMGTGLLTNLVDTFACLAPYALCAYANCSIIHGTNPPVAECGCAVSEVTLAKRAYSVGTGLTVLNANLRTATENKCGSFGISNSVCSNPPNKAPFCAQMKRDKCGKVAMYGGAFDVISTFNTTTWPANITTPMGGSGPAPQYCSTGVYTNCFSAACILKKAWNGMPATCYCPVYNFPGAILSASSEGYTCSGQTENGVLQYIQNGI